MLQFPTTHTTSCTAALATGPLLHAPTCSPRRLPPPPRTDNGLGNKRNSPDCLLMFHRMRPDWRNNSYRRIS